MNELHSTHDHDFFAGIMMSHLACCRPLFRNLWSYELLLYSLWTSTAAPSQCLHANAACASQADIDDFVGTSVLLVKTFLWATAASSCRLFDLGVILVDKIQPWCVFCHTHSELHSCMQLAEHRLFACLLARLQRCCTDVNDTK
jgi:hypothetical protein